MTGSANKQDPQLVAQLRAAFDRLNISLEPHLVEHVGDLVKTSTDFVSKLGHGERTALLGSIASFLGSAANSAPPGAEGKSSLAANTGKEKAARTIGIVGGQVGSTLALAELPQMMANAAGRGFNPASIATSVVLLTFFDKTLMTTGLVTDSEHAKCVQAVAQLAVNAGFLTVSAVTAGAGIATFGLGIAVVAAGYSAVQGIRHWNDAKAGGQ